jgi:HNH endonuclease
MTNISARERLFRKTEADPETGCILWRGRVTPKGYGTFWFNGTNALVHRASWEIANGPIPAGTGHHGTCVCHRCDTPLCVNPNHLFLGSNRDNVDDRHAKGRSRGGSLAGERHPFAKLTAAQVADIRAAKGREPLTATARRLNISKSWACMIQKERGRRAG